MTFSGCLDLYFFPLVGSDGRSFGMVEHSSMVWGSVQGGMYLGVEVDLGGVVHLSAVVDLGGMVYFDLGGTVVWS
jgi:hypothetical protein